MKPGPCCAVAISFLALVVSVAAQTSPSNPETTSASVQVPRLIKFSGIAKDETGKPVSGILGITFALYQDEQGGAPLWLETQNIHADTNGHYTVMLGADKPEGLPLDLFTSGEARWLGVRAEGQKEQPRVLLVSVPYAIKAHEAETLSGRSISDFVLLNETKTSVARTNSQMSSNGLGSPSQPPTNGPTNFAGSNTTQIVGVTQSGSGTGLSAMATTHAAVAGTITGASNTAVYGLASNTTAGSSAAGVTGAANTQLGPGVQGVTTSSKGFGVQGVVNSTSGGTAVQGLNKATSGVSQGVSGQTSSVTTNSSGVNGFEAATTGQVYGVTGSTNSNTANAAGVSGYEGAATGRVFGVNGGTNSTTQGAAAVNGFEGATTGQVFGVAGTTNSTANYAAGVSGFEGATTGTVFGVQGGTNSTTQGAAAVNGFEGATTGQVFGVSGGTNSTTQGATAVNGFEGATTGAVFGVHGGTNSTTQGAAGVNGFEGATTGQVVGVQGTTNSTTNYAAGVNGFEGATTGTVFGVEGGAKSTTQNSAGVSGYESATTGQVYGVNGGTNSTTNYAAGVNGYEGAATGQVFGVSGETPSAGPFAIGVIGSATAATGQNYGVMGNSASSNGIAVFGNAYATSGFAVGVEGKTASSGGVGGQFVNTSGTGLVLLGQSGSSYNTVFTVDASGNGNFTGNLNVTGKLTKGSGSFKIDDPLDPAHKYLSHSFVESPDMMNVYNGLIVLDANGSAWVRLPDYFEALNRDFRYQITAIGTPGPNLYIAKKISGNRFKIAGGKPHGEVSWQVTGIRHDAYADAYRIPVEEEKPPLEQGHYLHPELFGASERLAIGAGGAVPSTGSAPPTRASMMNLPEAGNPVK